MHIRMIAVTATAIVLAFALSPASARSCNDGGDAACPQQSAPMQLDNFMKTWKPVAVSKRAGKSRTARRHAAQKAAAESKSKAAAKEPEVAEAKPEPAATETPPPAETRTAFATPPGQTSETDGVAVTSFNQPNELDAAADDQIQVVAFNEINELDLAAPPPPVPAETVGQSVAAEQTPADNSWIGKLLLAAAGTIAIAGATRLLVA